MGVLIVAAVIGALLLVSGGGGKTRSATGGSSVAPSDGSITTHPSASAGAPTTSTTPATSAAPKAPAQLHTADGLNGLVATIRAKFGDTMGYRLVVYPTYGDIERANPTNEHVVQNFMYRDGQWSNWAPDTSKSSLDFLADVGQFNAAAVAAAIANPPATLDITDPTKSYLVIEGADGGGIDLQIHNNAPGTGFMMLNPDGTVKQLFPPS